ncbi:MAG: hypothetical protein FVQ80_11115 [Planctomycetes bacterium]|nr:hypothetical protein [Planctomycetota bacterium]
MIQAGIKEELNAVMHILKPDEGKTHDQFRTMEEDLSYLRVIAQYVMLDKEASCREAFNLGRETRGK